MHKETVTAEQLITRGLFKPFARYEAIDHGEKVYVIYQGGGFWVIQHI